MWPNLQLPADLVTFTEEVLNGKSLLYVVQIKWICHEIWWNDQRILKIQYNANKIRFHSDMKATLLYHLMRKDNFF